MTTEARIAKVETLHGPGDQRKSGHPVTSVRVTIELTVAQARKLPPPSKVKTFLGQGAQYVTSRVRRDGGEVVVVYYVRDRPFNGAAAKDIPQLALEHVRAKLNAGL